MICWWWMTEWVTPATVQDFVAFFNANLTRWSFRGANLRQFTLCFAICCVHCDVVGGGPPLMVANSETSLIITGAIVLPLIVGCVLCMLSVGLSTELRLANYASNCNSIVCKATQVSSIFLRATLLIGEWPIVNESNWQHKNARRCARRWQSLVANCNLQMMQTTFGFIVWHRNQFASIARLFVCTAMRATRFNLAMYSQRTISVASMFGKQSKWPQTDKHWQDQLCAIVCGEPFLLENAIYFGLELFCSDSIERCDVNVHTLICLALIEWQR